MEGTLLLLGNSWFLFLIVVSEPFLLVSAQPVQFLRLSQSSRLGPAARPVHVRLEGALIIFLVSGRNVMVAALAPGFTPRHFPAAGGYQWLKRVAREAFVMEELDLPLNLPQVHASNPKLLEGFVYPAHL